MISKPCYKEQLEYNPEAPEEEPKVVAIGTSCRVTRLYEEIAGWATAFLSFYDDNNVELPALAIRCSTKLPDMYLLQFRRVMDMWAPATEKEVDEIHQLILYSPEGRASIPSPRQLV